MTSHDLSKIILDKIHTEKLAPKARWQLQLRRGGLWLAAVFCLGLGSIAVGTTLSIAKNNDWDLYRSTGSLSQPLFFIMLSYAWILLLLACMGGAYYLFIHTRHGYRYRVTSVLFFTVSFGALIGLGVFFAGVGHAVDEQFEKSVPAYANVISPRHKIWVQPDQGRLAGKVQRVKAPLKFTIIDPRGRLWIVETDASVEETVKQLQEHYTVHMTGSKVDDSTFHANAVQIYRTTDNRLFIFRAQNKIQR